MRLTTDLFAYCRERVPKWNTISISGYHMREKGCSAVQEVGFTLANAIAYVQAAIDAGLQVDEFGPRLAFFFNGHNNVFQEVAKFRAARRMWARIMRERFGSKDESSLKMRFHTQTGGVTLAAQQPHNNIVRVALQGFAAVCGRHAVAAHERLRRGARAAERDRGAHRAAHQQILAHESGAADTADPFAGSYFVEALTDEIEEAAQALIDRVDEMGGSVNCIPFIRAEVEESAWGYEERYRQKQDIVVGVNEYVTDQIDEVEILRVDPESERQQVERLKAFKADRDQAAVDARLEELREACGGDTNLLEPMRAALKERASIGEVCGVMREEFGEYSGGLAGPRAISSEQLAHRGDALGPVALGPVPLDLGEDPERRSCARPPPSSVSLITWRGRPAGPRALDVAELLEVGDDLAHRLLAQTDLGEVGEPGPVLVDEAEDAAVTLSDRGCPASLRRGWNSRSPRRPGRRGGAQAAGPGVLAVMLVTVSSGCLTVKLLACYGQAS